MHRAGTRSTLLRRKRDQLSAAFDQLESQMDCIEAIAGLISTAFSEGGRLLSAGNGGSATQAQHFTTELVGRYRRDRPALDAVCLCCDSALLTALGNDFGGTRIFERQVAAYARKGDVLFVLSTSGSSDNLLRAASRAHAAGAKVVSATGATPNPLASASDLSIGVSVSDRSNVQEAHLALIHVLTDLIDGAHQ